MSEKGLAEHYKVLKQFLVISDDLSTRTKTNSTRAARAREKLLKLSSAQFRELSTDVYDELKRRIDESRGEPDYLLPKSTFHPKRNQARQKLSSLPQSRFKDLVSDISFEIERRDLHHATTSDVNNNYASSDNSKLNQVAQENGREIENRSNLQNNNNGHINREDLKEMEEDIKNSIQRSNSSELLNQTIGVQPKTVIPTKANLTWSSDEENDDDQPDINSLDILVDGDRAVNRSLDNQNDTSLSQKGPDLNEKISELRNRLENIEYEKMQLQEKYDLLKSDYEYSASQNKTLSDEMDNLSEEKNSWLKNKSDYEKQLKTLQSEAKSRFINESKNNDLLAELENLKAVNATLRLENHSLKNTSPREVTSTRETATSPQRSIASARETPAFTSLNALNEINGISPQRSNATPKDISLNVLNATSHTSNDLKKDMELFFEKLSDLDSASVKTQNKIQLQDNNVALWQGRYEALRSNQISSSLKKSLMSRNELKMFITPSGLISMKLVTDLQALVESFLLNLNDPNPVPDVLFDKISKISLLGNEIANQGDKQHLNSNENSICLREAVSYALTATRYYAIFSDILPKKVVEQSLGEVCFTVCELVSVSKLNENSTDTRNIYQEPNQLLNEAFRYNESNATENDINTAVRPLKMANKLREYQNQSFNNAAKEVESSSTPTKGLNEDSILDPLNVTPTRNRNLAQAKTNHTDSVDVAKLNDSSPVRRGIIPGETSSIQDLSNKPNPSPKAKNISALASRFESGNDLPEEKGLSKSYSSAPTKYSNSNLSSSESKEIDPNAISNKANTTPTKRSNILDRVKQFDSPTNEKLNNHQNKINSPTNDQKSILMNSTMDQSQINELNEDVNNSFLVSRSSLEIRQQSQEDRSDSALSSPQLDNVNENESIDSKVNAEADFLGKVTATTGTAFAGSRSKGLFQSIRNRIAPGSDKSSTTETSREEKSNTSTDSVRLPDAGTNSPKTSDDAVNNTSGWDKNLESKPIASDNANDIEPVNALLQNIKKSDTEIETSKPKSFDDAKMNGTNASITQQEKETNMPLASVSNKEMAKKGVNFLNDINTSQVSDEESTSGSESDPNEHPEEAQARQRQEYRKSMAAATFNVDLFDIDDPDNTLTQVLLYLEHQTVQVISTIQSLLSAIKKPSATRGDLRQKSIAITEVISQMTEATNTSMNQTRNAQLKEHGSWVVKSLDDCNHRMNILCKPNADKSDSDFADKNFKQRLAGISFDIAKCTKELVKTVEEASLKEDIANIDARLSQTDDLT